MHLLAPEVLLCAKSYRQSDSSFARSSSSRPAKLRDSSSLIWEFRLRSSEDPPRRDHSRIEDDGRDGRGRLEVKDEVLKQLCGKIQRPASNGLGAVRRQSRR